MRWASSTMTRSQWTCRSPGRISVRLARSSEVMTLLLLQPLVDAELVADVAALQDEELLVELLLQFPLPLEGQVGRADDQDPFGQAAQLQFTDEKAGHDRLAGTGIVGQQEADAGSFRR